MGFPLAPFISRHQWPIGDPIIPDEMEKDSHTLGGPEYFLQGGFLVYAPLVVHHPDPVPDTRELFNKLKVHGSLSADSQKLRDC